MLFLSPQWVVLFRFFRRCQLCLVCTCRVSTQRPSLKNNSTSHSFIWLWTFLHCDKSATSRMHDLCYTLLRDFVTLGAADIAITSLFDDFRVYAAAVPGRRLWYAFEIPLSPRLSLCDLILRPTRLVYFSLWSCLSRPVSEEPPVSPFTVAQAHRPPEWHAMGCLASRSARSGLMERKGFKVRKSKRYTLREVSALVQPLRMSLAR